MINSMTGFASRSRDYDYGQLNLELRSVNHRYLEIQLRIPDELRSLESGLRDTIGQKLSRGKVDCRLGYTPIPSAAKGLPLNQGVLQQLIKYNDSIKALVPGGAPLSVSNILNFPGIFDQDAPPVERISADALALLAETLSELSHSRAREGDKLKAILLERGARLDVLAAEATPLIPKLIAAFEEKLATKIREALAGPADDRLRQEVVLFASKIDVDEELSRLKAHLTEVRRVLEKGGGAGKRLDFLMQELNREANTLGAKSVSSEVSKISVEMKVLIEQMREQIQNIE
jgi:uncharacterized protein (TIGR00255 family)